MSRTKKHAEPAAESAEPGTVAAEEIASESQPLQVIDIEEAVAFESLSETQKLSGVSFFFGEIGMIQFPDGSQHFAGKHREFVTDPELIEKLTEAAKKPRSKIFPE